MCVSVLVGDGLKVATERVAEGDKLVVLLWEKVPVGLRDPRLHDTDPGLTVLVTDGLEWERV